MRKTVSIAAAPWAFIITLIGICGLPSCSSTPERGHVQKEWALTLRELGVSPIFPPREDVHVGDVYLRERNPADVGRLEEKGFVPIDLWLASIDLSGEAAALQSQRASYPDSAPSAATPAEGVDVAPTPAWGPPQQDGVGNVHLHRDLTRLRQVAFPDFASLVVQSGDLRGLIPVQALSIAFGAAWNSTHSVTVKIPEAESIGVPANRVVDRVVRIDKGRYFVAPSVVPLPLLVLAGQRATEQDSESIYIDVITEVFYARALDLSISREEDFGAKIDVAPVAAPGGDDESELPETSDEPPASTEPQDAFERARRLNQKLAEVGGRSDPHGTVQFLAASDHSVAMRRSFLRPIAVGFRGFTLAVCPTTGEVLNFGAANSVAATTSGALALAGARAAEALNTIATRLGFEADIEFGGGRWEFTVPSDVGLGDVRDRLRGDDSRSIRDQVVDGALLQPGLSADDRAALEAVRAGDYVLREDPER